MLAKFLLWLFLRRQMLRSLWLLLRRLWLLLRRQRQGVILPGNLCIAAWYLHLQSSTLQPFAASCSFNVSPFSLLSPSPWRRHPSRPPSLTAGALGCPWRVSSETPCGLHWSQMAPAATALRCNSAPYRSVATAFRQAIAIRHKRRFPKPQTSSLELQLQAVLSLKKHPQGQQAPPHPMLVPSGTSAVNLSCTRRELAPLQQRSVPFRCNSVRWHQCCRAGPSRDAEASYVGGWSAMLVHFFPRHPCRRPSRGIPRYDCLAPTLHPKFLSSAAEPWRPRATNPEHAGRAESSSLATT